MDLTNTNKQELKDILVELERILTENREYFFKHMELVRDFGLDVESTIKLFIKLCMHFQIYDKVGDTFYNACKIFKIFPYGNNKIEDIIKN
jgi:hypothetical protein